jgi:hypothetical protein
VTWRNQVHKKGDNPSTTPFHRTNRLQNPTKIQCETEGI